MGWSVFETYSFEDIVRYGISLLVFFSMLLAVIYTIWGWFLMVVSGWSEDKVKSAVNHIRYAVLGIAVLVVILFISPLFLNLFGLPYGQYFSPTSILSSVQEISAKIFWGSGTMYENDIYSPTNDGFAEF